MSRDKYEGSIGARAVVTIELDGLGSWGTGYTMDQIIDQGRDAAVGRIRNAFRQENEGEGRIKITAVDVTAVYAPGKAIRAG